MSSDLLDVFLLSLLAMFNPSLLAAVTVMLLLPDPKRRSYKGAALHPRGGRHPKQRHASHTGGMFVGAALRHSPLMASRATVAALSGQDVHRACHD